MRERQPSRMQERPLQPLHGSDVSRNAPMDASVQRVADNRMADGAQVDANLMCPPGVNRHLTERETGQMMGARDARHRLARIFRPRRHLLPIGRVATDRRIDPSSGLHDPPDQRDVLLLDLAIVELTRQLLMRAVVLGDHHEPGRPSIEPVNDPWPQLAADAAEIGQMVKQRVHQRARPVSRCRVDHHPRRLVQHREIQILVEDLEGQRFRADLGGRGVRCVHDDLIAVVNLKVGARRERARRRTPDGHVTVGDQLLDLRPRIVGEHRNEIAVQTLAGRIVLDDEITWLSIGH